MTADISFDGKVVIVTGAGNGLGRSHALLFASRGAQVVVNDLGGTMEGTGESASPALAVVEEIVAAGGIAVADQNNVSTIEGGEEIVKTAIRSFGRVDVVINNAGILRDRSISKMEASVWDPVVAVHLRGTMAVSRAAWPHLIESGSGRIVNTSSNAGIFGNFGQSNYGAAKMGIIGFTRVLAQEGAKHGICVNAIAPIARTRMTEALLGKLADKLDPSLVSPVVAYLASIECTLTGEILSTGGGRVSRLFIGATPGICDPQLSVEGVRDSINEILDESGYVVPTSTTGETALFVRYLRSLDSGAPSRQ
ncbi:MAG TPA: SDR family oxidoreductase [Mycobacterium sp.]|nr:SDR family oxidoreductase [Mycobacterium sp.]